MAPLPLPPGWAAARNWAAARLWAWRPPCPTWRRGSRPWPWPAAVGDGWGGWRAVGGWLGGSLGWSRAVLTAGYGWWRWPWESTRRDAASGTGTVCVRPRWARTVPAPAALPAAALPAAGPGVGLAPCGVAAAAAEPGPGAAPEPVGNGQVPESMLGLHSHFTTRAAEVHN